VPQERNTANLDRGTGRETYGLGNVCGKCHVIAEDQIETAGAGIDAVTDHVIVTVVTLLLYHWLGTLQRKNILL